MYRVIVVDDEPFMLEGMRLMIDWPACGFELAGEASTAREALRLIDKTHPQLIITDIRMPGLLGTELAELIARDHPEIIVLFFSGYRDFTYAQAAIRSQVFGYLLKPIDSDEVHGVLRGVKAELDRRSAQKNDTITPVMREHALRRLAYGDDSAEALLQCGSLLNIDKDTPVCLAAVDHDDAQTSKTDSIEDMWNIAGDAAFLLSPTLVGILFRADADQSALIERKRALQKSYARVYIGVGRLACGAEGLRDSLRQAIDALGPWFKAKNGLRLFRAYDDGLPHWLLDADVAGLENALRQKSPNAVEAQLSQLERAFEAKKPDAFYLRVMAHNLDALLSRDGSNSAFRPFWLDESDDTHAWMKNFLTTVRAYFSTVEAENSATPPIVRQVLRYIEDEYAKNASIGEIAARLYINPAYLGQLVRRYTGETFHKHLLSARMSQANRLLMQTQKTVGEIAAEVGIRDVDYFSIQFRTRFGVSPNAYRGGAREKGIPS